MPGHYGHSHSKKSTSGGSSGRGRTDAGPNRTTAYKAGVGNITESGKKTAPYQSSNDDAFRNRGATKIKKGIKTPSIIVNTAASFLSTPLQKGSVITRDFFTDKVLSSKRGDYKNLDKLKFSSLNKAEQEDIYKEYISNRHDNKIDAYGNPIGGWRKEKVKHKRADGTYELRDVWMGGNDNNANNTLLSQEPKSGVVTSDGIVGSNAVITEEELQAKKNKEGGIILAKKRGRSEMIKTSSSGLVDEDNLISKKTLLG